LPSLRAQWRARPHPESARPTSQSSADSETPRGRTRQTADAVNIVSEPRAVATGSKQTCNGTTHSFDLTVVAPELARPSLSVRVLTLSREAHLDHIRHMQLHPSIAFRSIDTSCFPGIPTDLVRSSRVLLLSGRALHSPSSRSESLQVSCWLRPPHEHGSFEPLPSTAANLV